MLYFNYQIGGYNMLISGAIKKSINIGDDPFIGFNELTKEVNLFIDSREYKNTHTYVDRLNHISSSNIGENLIDFLSIPETGLNEIRNAAASGGTYKFPDLVDKFECLYIYLIYNLANSSSLKNEYSTKLEYISQEFRFALDYCCNIESHTELRALSNLQRYYLYCIQYPDNINTSSWGLDPSRKMIIEPYGIYDPIKDLSINKREFNNPDCPEWHAPITNTSNVPEDIISWVKQANVSKTDYYICSTIEEYLIIEFRKMIELNIKVKKCRNCGQYFVLKGDYSTDYCNRIHPGEKFTCKKIAAVKARKEKLNSNPILKEYEKAYKRNYAKCINKSINKEDFCAWVDESTAKRKIAVEQYENTPDEQIVNEFKNYLNNK